MEIIIKKQCRQLSQSFLEFSAKVNWIVFGLIIVFAPSSWLNVNGVLSEIPNMINNLPEKWRLPSHISILTQIAQLVPLLYLFARWLCPVKLTHQKFIYLLLVVNALTCYMLSYFWNKTLNINNEERSFGLYFFSFISALITGSATLSFLPYIADKFSKEYIFAYYIGESFSALIPGVLALVQGVEQNQDCGAATSTLNKEPNFSVLIYFICIFFILCVSVFAFTLIDVLPYVNRFTKRAIVATPEERRLELAKPLNTHDTADKMLLFFYNFLITFFMFGFLPGLQSYSTMPYGNLVYSLSINLSYVSLPSAVFISIWSYKISTTRLSIELMVALLLTVYIIVISALSPCPFLVQYWLGSFLTVLAWFVASFVYIRLRCIIATKLEKFGQNIFMALGLVSLFGQVMGGLTVFLLVDTLRLFKEKPECVNDFSYCN